eukprot:765976-Hanusia_phi.AAC.13
MRPRSGVRCRIRFSDTLRDCKEIRLLQFSGSAVILFSCTLRWQRLTRLEREAGDKVGQKTELFGDADQLVVAEAQSLEVVHETERVRKDDDLIVVKVQQLERGEGRDVVGQLGDVVVVGQQLLETLHAVEKTVRQRGEVIVRNFHDKNIRKVVQELAGVRLEAPVVEDQSLGGLGSPQRPEVGKDLAGSLGDDLWRRGGEKFAMRQVQELERLGEEAKLGGDRLHPVAREV